MSEPAPTAAATPSEARSLRANIAYSIVGNGLLNLGRVAVIAMLTKFTPRDVLGAYYFATVTLAAPLVMFCGLELRAAYVADARREFPFGAYRTLRNIGMTLAAATLLVVLLLRAASDGRWSLLPLMLFGCAGRLLFHFAEVYWGVFQKRERLDLVGWSNGIRGLGMIVPFVILMPLWGDATDAGRSTTVASVAAGIYVTVSLLVWRRLDRPLAMRGDVDLSWTWPQVTALARRTLPLGLVILIIMLCESVPQFVIAEQEDGLADLGAFGAMRIITMGAGFVLLQVATAAGNRLAIYYREDARAFLRLALRLTGVATAIAGAILVLTVVAGRWFLATLYTPEYAAYYPEFVILVVAQAVILLASIFGFVTTHMQRYWVQVPIQLAVLAVTTAFAWWLIPSDPVGGGAWTALARSITQAALYSVCVLVGVRRRLGQANPAAADEGDIPRGYQ